jgi:hypothetical protein
MIKIEITPRLNETTDKTWWFAEWPDSGDVTPSKMCRLLEIVYSDVGYTGTVGMSIKLVGFDPRKYVLHNQSGGLGWRYYTNDRTVEIEDEQLATMFILKFGG